MDLARGLTNGAIQHALVEDAQSWVYRSAQNCLARQKGNCLLVKVVQVPGGAGAEDRAGVLLGLQQAGHDERLGPAQHRGLRFDVGPLPNRPCFRPFFR